MEAVNSFKLLGCIFDSELDNLAINYTKAISAMRKELFLWSTKKLSIKGKITVIKTYALSKMNHLVTILPTLKNDFVKEIENLLCKFINPGRTLFPKQLIFMPIKNQGLGLQKIETFWNSLKIAWFRRTYSSNSLWLKLLTENITLKIQIA